MAHPGAPNQAPAITQRWSQSGTNQDTSAYIHYSSIHLAKAAQIHSIPGDPPHVCCSSNHTARILCTMQLVTANPCLLHFQLCSQDICFMEQQDYDLSHDLRTPGPIGALSPAISPRYAYREHHGTHQHAPTSALTIPPGYNLYGTHLEPPACTHVSSICSYRENPCAELHRNNLDHTPWSSRHSTRVAQLQSA